MSDEEIDKLLHKEAKSAEEITFYLSFRDVHLLFHAVSDYAEGLQTAAVFDPDLTDEERMECFINLRCCLQTVSVLEQLLIQMMSKDGSKKQ